LAGQIRSTAVNSGWVGHYFGMERIETNTSALAASAEQMNGKRHKLARVINISLRMNLNYEKGGG